MKPSAFVNKLIKHIQDPAKLSYGVRLSTGKILLNYISAPKNIEKESIQNRKLDSPDKKARNRLSLQNVNEISNKTFRDCGDTSAVSKLIL